ncbi:MAG: hypothetical protein HXL57_01230 [Solobacterium sp.]|nr:hypothetical protein [Solobacterium sp.]
MVKDRIVVFNRLTDHTIADCSIFEELLENHYQKFVYFYNIIENNDIIEYVDDVYCIPTRHRLDVYITLNSDVDMDIRQEIEENFQTCYLYKHFDSTVHEDEEGTIIVSIKDI